MEDTISWQAHPKRTQSQLCWAWGQCREASLLCLLQCCTPPTSVSFFCLNTEEITFDFVHVRETGSQVCYFLMGAHVKATSNSSSCAASPLPVLTAWISLFVPVVCDFIRCHSSRLIPVLRKWWHSCLLHNQVECGCQAFPGRSSVSGAVC